MGKGRIIAIGKFGQKLIFNRDSNECKRSNTNGNVGAYNFFKLLIKNNPNDMFIVIGENDLSSMERKPLPNVIDGSYKTLGMLDLYPIDFAILSIGVMKESNPDDVLLSWVNHSNAPWLLVADDPRCLDTKAKDFKNYPKDIVSITKAKTLFAGKEYEVEYAPIETADCFEYDMENSGFYYGSPKYTEKNRNFTIVANTSGDKYNRVAIVEEFTKNIQDVKIYGRVDEEVKQRNRKFKGEVSYEEINKIMEDTKVTFIVPIQKGYVTSKYIEALMHGVLPIMHPDYNLELIGGKLLFDVAKTPEELEKVVGYCLSNDELRMRKVEMLRDVYLKDATNGKRLSEIIMDKCKEYRDA